MSRLMIWWMEIWRSTWCRRQASGGCRAVLPMWVENEIDRWSHWGNVLGSQICCFAVEHTALAQEACWTDYLLDPPSWHGACFYLGFFYVVPYHPISLLENDQYERIWRLRLIVYHHNLHLWYMVVYIGGIRVLLEVLSRWHKRNMWFLHFKLFSFPSGDMAIFFQISNRNFHFKFQKCKKSFQSSKMKIFNFFHFKFPWHISIFFISHWWYGQFFSKFKINFFSKIFHFPLVVWPFFLKIQE
jgi:hypothetical protein